MLQGHVKVFFSMGGNFLSATPDTTCTAKALRKLDLSVSVSTKLNRTHLIYGKESLILPTLSRSDIDLVNGEPQIEIGRAHAELQSLMRISYDVFCLKKKKKRHR